MSSNCFIFSLAKENEASFHSTPYSSHEHTYIANPNHYQAGIVVHRLPQVNQDQVYQNGHWGPPTITQWD